MTPKEIIAHVLLMGNNLYDTPEDWAEALLKRLNYEGYVIRIKDPVSATRPRTILDEQHEAAWHEKQRLR